MLLLRVCFFRGEAPPPPPPPPLFCARVCVVNARSASCDVGAIGSAEVDLGGRGETHAAAMAAAAIEMSASKRSRHAVDDGALLIAPSAQWPRTCGVGAPRAGGGHGWGTHTSTGGGGGGGGAHAHRRAHAHTCSFPKAMLGPLRSPCLAFTCSGAPCHTRRDRRTRGACWRSLLVLTACPPPHRQRCCRLPCPRPCPRPCPVSPSLRPSLLTVAPSTPGPAMAAPPSTPATFAALENAAQQPIDYHDLTSFEVEAAINSSITLLSERIKAPIETPKRATFSFASKVKSFLSSTPSFLRFGGSANNSAAPESPPRSHPAGPTALLTSPTAEAEGKENTVHRFGQALENVEMAHMGQLQVPAPVFALIMDIRSRGLYHEGLFRIAGNKRRVKVLRKFYDAGEPVPEAEAADASVHDYADLLKEYLRVLPDPLIGTTLTPILLAVSRLQDTLDAAQMVRDACATRLWAGRGKSTDTRLGDFAAGCGVARARGERHSAHNAPALPHSRASSSTRLSSGIGAVLGRRGGNEPPKQDEGRQPRQGRVVTRHSRDTTHPGEMAHVRALALRPRAAVVPCRCSCPTFASTTWRCPPRRRARATSTLACRRCWCGSLRSRWPPLPCRGRLPRSAPSTTGPRSRAGDGRRASASAHLHACVCGEG